MHSLQRLGAVLEQCVADSKRPQPIHIVSTSLSKDLRNYSITELEVAVVWAITKFPHYLSTRPFQFVTDHSALKHILTDKGNVLTGRLAWWKLLLQEYHYEVVYRPGVDSVIPDALSRHPFPPDKEPPYDETQECLACLEEAHVFPR